MKRLGWPAVFVGSAATAAVGLGVADAGNPAEMVLRLLQTDKVKLSIITLGMVTVVKLLVWAADAALAHARKVVSRLVDEFERHGSLLGDLVDKIERLETSFTGLQQAHSSLLLHHGKYEEQINERMRALELWQARIEGGR